ncbi:MAG: hypothetical protein A2161_06670 [Candidatus Schekmanbacteria bacterium RBG_13_48_7]|uniref:Polymerase beta nucleotidyltransferase domain-containing protein n=1 Tax=Candidatus Schekmanbacteria bacterium RBG_13_48_7 TaxID=1817878 RepID=A0A1F7RLN9_9BACT|nr:MAG: hypothetical protein A2161_06670 [Candidatus Schekmanbacteria bacterium RBG_13_48_7]
MIKFGKKIEHDLLALIPCLIAKIRTDTDIAAIYLFGSRATGKTGPLSDIDLAYLIEPKYDQHRMFEKHIELINITTECLSTDEVTVLILNEVPLPIKYEVICNSNLIYDVKPGYRQLFEVFVIKEYLDFRYALDYYDSVTLRKVAREDIYD